MPRAHVPAAGAIPNPPIPPLRNVRVNDRCLQKLVHAQKSTLFSGMEQRLLILNHNAYVIKITCDATKCKKDPRPAVKGHPAVQEAGCNTRIATMHMIMIEIDRILWHAYHFINCITHMHIDHATGRYVY